MAFTYPPTSNGLEKSLGAQLDTGVTSSATFNNTTGIQNLKGLFVVDRIDTSGAEKNASFREYISFAGVSGSTVTTLVRGLGGTTDQDHGIGAVVEFVSDVVQQQAIIDTFLVGHTDSGAHSTGMTLTTPVIASLYQDAGKTKLMTLPNTASDTLAAIAATQTLTNKTLTSPKVNEDVAVTATATELNLLAGKTALSAYKVGILTRATNAANGDVATTGVGFQPKGIIFFAQGITKAWSNGMSDGTTSTLVAAYETATSYTDATSCIKIGDGASWAQKALVKTFDADGFTLTWTMDGTGPGGTATVIYMAYR